MLIWKNVKAVCWCTSHHFQEHTESDHLVKAPMISLTSWFALSNATGKSFLWEQLAMEILHTNHSQLCWKHSFYRSWYFGRARIVGNKWSWRCWFGSNPTEVDYAKIYYARRPLLERSCQTFLWSRRCQKTSEKFAQENQSWLELFAEYMAIKGAFW